jgi:hypothetical protein
MIKTLSIILLAVVFILASCHKDDSNDSRKLFINNSSTVNITIEKNHPGKLIPSTFEGLSFENGIFGQDVNFLNTDNKVFIQLLKNLGPGILRMGGATSDFTKWLGAPRDANTPLNVITTTDIDRLSAFSVATGWPVLFGLNLGENNTATAAKEAAYIHQSLGLNLYAFQSGNEPDAFGPYSHLRGPDYAFNDFLAEWDTYQTAVRAIVPGAEFAGPDIAFNNYWIEAFAGRKFTSVKLLDGHYYETGPASSESINYQSILGNSFKLKELLHSFKAAPGVGQLPFRVTECNNVYGGGKQGVSDVFASALWALETMWILADNGCEGINFHNGIGLNYSPVLSENGKLTAKPEYYAMLAFKYASTNGRTVPTKIDEGQYCSAHTSLVNGTYYITLINRNTTRDFDFNIIPGKIIANIQVSRLTAPAITAKTGITFGGSSVNTDGTLSALVPENITVNKPSFVVKVPAGSAVVIIAH